MDARFLLFLAAPESLGSKMSNAIYPSQVRGLTFTVVKTQENSVIVKGGSNFVVNTNYQNRNPKWHWTLQYSVLFDSPLFPNTVFTYTDLQILIGFIQARNGIFDSFLFFDPDDNSVGPGVFTSLNAPWKANWPFMLGAIIIVSGNAWQVSSAPWGAKTSDTVPSFASSPQIDGGITWTQLGAVSGAGWPNPQAQLQVVTDGTNWFSPIQRHLGGQFWEDITDLVSGITVYDNGSLVSPVIGFGNLTAGGLNTNGLYLNWGTSAPTSPVTATFQYYFRVRFEENSQDIEKFVNSLWAIGGDEGQQGKGYLKLVSAPFPTSGIPGAGGSPLPPFAGCSPNVLTLYPKQITLNQRNGFAAGVAGPNNWFTVLQLNQFLGAAGGVATFSNYDDPSLYGVSRGQICGVYSYIPYTHTYIGFGLAIVDQAMSANGFGMIGGPNSTAVGTFLTGPGPGSLLVSLIQGSVTIANIDFSTIIQSCFTGTSLPGFYGDPITGHAMVLVYYN